MTLECMNLELLQYMMHYDDVYGHSGSVLATDIGRMSVAILIVYVASFIQNKADN